MFSEEEGEQNIGDEPHKMTHQEYRHSIHRRISTLQSMTKSEPLYEHLGSLTVTFNYIVSEGVASIAFEQSLKEIENIMKSTKTDAEKLIEIKEMKFLDI
jgi:methyl coenzyme M reductase subunit C-like uncharacterized protein (methanogenesis marker protein 7)